MMSSIEFYVDIPFLGVLRTVTNIIVSPDKGKVDGLSTLFAFNDWTKPKGHRRRRPCPAEYLPKTGRLLRVTKGESRVVKPVGGWLKT